MTAPRGSSVTGPHASGTRHGRFVPNEGTKIVAMLTAHLGVHRSQLTEWTSSPAASPNAKQQSGQTCIVDIWNALSCAGTDNSRQLSDTNIKNMGLTPLPFQLGYWLRINSFLPTPPDFPESAPIPPAAWISADAIARNFLPPEESTGDPVANPQTSGWRMSWPGLCHIRDNRIPLPMPPDRSNHMTS